MSDRLVPCPGCARHVKALETGCPFCGSRLAELPAERPRPTARLGRAATFAFGAALAATGCAEHHGANDSGVEEEDSAVVDDAGEVQPDAGRDAGRDAGNIAPPYGTPPEDGGIAPLYGGAP